MTTQTLTLTEFLLARIAEDEAGYRAETAGIEWLTLNGRNLWDHLLAECEAKRRIVELHDLGIDAPCVSDCYDGDRHGCATLKALASVYTDHPDFNPAWR